MNLNNDSIDRQALLSEWREIPLSLEHIVSSLSTDDLSRTVPALGFSVRATVHHLAEANIVAASMIIAAMGKSGSTYDWTWLYPNADWCSRLGYDNAPIEPALDTLRSLLTHISIIVASQENSFERQVMVFDSPGTPTYGLTVGQIIRQEVDHAEEHLGDVRKTFLQQT